MRISMLHIKSSKNTNQASWTHLAMSLNLKEALLCGVIRRKDQLVKYSLVLFNNFQLKSIILNNITQSDKFPVKKAISCCFT
jgi:hypothetical protein